MLAVAATGNGKGSILELLVLVDDLDAMIVVASLGRIADSGKVAVHDGRVGRDDARLGVGASMGRGRAHNLEAVRLRAGRVRGAKYGVLVVKREKREKVRSCNARPERGDMGVMRCEV